MTTRPTTRTATLIRSVCSLLNYKLPLTVLAIGLAAATAQAYVFGDPLTFDNGKLTLDFNERVRVESRNNTFDFNSATNTVIDDNFILTRLRAGAKFTFTPKFSLYGQLQDSREFDSKRMNVPIVNAAEGDDPVNLRQLYADIGDPRDDVFTLRLGRQVLAYGDERLVGGFEWNNIARTFDALKVVYNAAASKTTVDAFAAHVVTVGDRNQTEESASILDRSDPHDLLRAFTCRTPAASRIKRPTCMLLYRDKNQNGPFYRANTLTTGASGVAPYDIPEKIWTAGFRAQSISSAPLGGFDYIVEAAFQWGKSRPGLTNAVVIVPNWFDHQAYALHAELGRSWERSKYFPRLAMEYNVASGDKNPNDTNNDAFLNLFPTNHKFYGYMDTLGWKNMRQIDVNLRFKPLADLDSSLKKSILRFDYRWNNLQTTQDLWYRANAITAVATPAAGIRAGLPSDLGREFDATWTWSPSPPYEILVGYSYFWTGDYLPARPHRGHHARSRRQRLVRLRAIHREILMPTSSPGWLETLAARPSGGARPGSPCPSGCCRTASTRATIGCTAIFPPRWWQRACSPRVAFAVALLSAASTSRLIKSKS